MLIFNSVFELRFQEEEEGVVFILSRSLIVFGKIIHSRQNSVLIKAKTFIEHFISNRLVVSDISTPHPSLEERLVESSPGVSTCFVNILQDRLDS